MVTAERAVERRDLPQKPAPAQGIWRRELYQLQSGEPTEDLRWLYDNLRLVHAELQDLSESVRGLGRLPAVRTVNRRRHSALRCFGARLLGGQPNAASHKPTVSTYLEAVQEIDPLRLAEIDNFLMCLKLGLLELLAQRGRQALEAFRQSGKEAQAFEVWVRPLRRCVLLARKNGATHSKIFRIVHRTLTPRSSRRLFAHGSETPAVISRPRGQSLPGILTSAKLKWRAWRLNSPRRPPLILPAPEALRNRLRHVGYYLIDTKGSQRFLQRVGYRPALIPSLQRLFRQLSR